MNNISYHMINPFNSKMEASTGGYSCEFVDTVPKDYLCAACKRVARDPQLTLCCGKHYCNSCIAPALLEGKACPTCGETSCRAFADKNYQRKILSLKVRCTMSDRGCEWTNKLERLEAHLDVAVGDCDYIDVECSNKCRQTVQKCDLPTHLTNTCPKREYTCQYCNFKATYEVVTNDHWPQCSFYTVPCPNACGIQAIERGDLEAHLLQCPMEEAECDFSHAGCHTTFRRLELERHMEENTQRHLALMSAVTLKISREFEQKLQEKDEKIRSLEEQLQKKIQETEARVTDLQKQLGEKTRHIQEFNRCNGILPFYFTMNNFEQHKTKSDYWHSPPMYTHPSGYNFQLEVLANGIGEGTHTHVSIKLWPLKGEFDDQLQWPAKFAITLQLLNQHKPRDHITMRKEFEYGKGFLGTIVYVFSDTFVSHAHLAWNARKQTRYLKDNRLHFRIIRVD